MPNYEIPTPADFVDWERVRQSDEYQKHMSAMLRIALERTIHSADYWERVDQRDQAIYQEIDDSTTLEEMDEIAERLETRTEEEQDIDADLSGLRTIADVEAYVQEHGVAMNVQKEVQELEKTYLNDLKSIEELKEEFGPMLADVREFFGWEKPKDPGVQ